MTVLAQVVAQEGGRFLLVQSLQRVLGQGAGVAAGDYGLLGGQSVLVQETKVFTLQTALPTLSAAGGLEHYLVTGVIMVSGALLEGSLEFVPRGVCAPVCLAPLRPLPHGDEAVHLAVLVVEEEKLQRVPWRDVYFLALEPIRGTLNSLDSDLIEVEAMAELVVLEDLFETRVEVFDEESELHSIDYNVYWEDRWVIIVGQ